MGEEEGGEKGRRKMWRERARQSRDGRSMTA